MLKFLTIVLLATSAIVGVARAVEFSDAIEGSPIPNPPYISTDVIPLIRGGVTYRLPVTSIAGSGGMALDANNATLPDARNNLGLGTASNVGFNSLTLTSPLSVIYGGTGQTTYTNGQLLIGNTTGNTLTKASLTAPAEGFTITGGTGSITFALTNDLSALEALGSTGIAARTASNTWAQRTITGTASRLSVTNGSGVAGNPTLDVDAAYVGQTSITTLGTVGTGTWQGAVVAGQYGGTGVANTGKTITLGGNLVTGGAFATTLTATATTSLTLPTTGTLATLGGPETFTNKILTAPIMTAPVLGAASATSITGLSAPVNDSDAVNKAYVNAIASGIFFHDEVKAASTANLSATYANGASGVGATLTNNGAQVAFASDGYSGLINDRFLIKDQTLTQNNGVYTLTTVGTGATNWVLTRATDFDANGGGEVTTGAALTVLNGTTLANSFWVETGQGAFTIGTTPIIFSRITTGAGGTVNSGTINQFGVYAAAGTTISGQSFTGLMKGNGASAPGVYGGTSCTDQFPRSLDLNGAATCATVGSADLASSLSLTGSVGGGSSVTVAGSDAATTPTANTSQSYLRLTNTNLTGDTGAQVQFGTIAENPYLTIGAVLTDGASNSAGDLVVVSRASSAGAMTEQLRTTRQGNTRIRSKFSAPDGIYTGAAADGTFLSWANDYIATPASVEAVSLLGLPAIKAASRSSDNVGAASSSTIASECLVVQDHTTVKHQTWCQYIEGTILASATTAFHVNTESSIDNRRAVKTNVADPYDVNLTIAGGDSPVTNLRLDNGIGTGSGGGTGISTTATTALDIINNAPSGGGDYLTGLLFGATALDTSAGRIAPAIAMATNHSIDWYRAQGQQAWRLYSTATTGNQTIILGNSGATFSSNVTAATFTGALTNATGLPIVGGTTGTLSVARGGTGLTAGTSGGIPAYTASGTLASSGALTAGMPVVGGGAGVAPTVGTRSGNTTAYVTTTGAQTLGRCVVIDANGNHIPDTGPCAVIDTVTTGISAAGTTQGTATLLSSVQNYVSTVAAGTGVRLQTGAAGGREYIINEGANELLIYPATGVTINSLSANTPVSLAVDTTVQLIAKSATAWRTVP